jgi:HAD superfamily hydrolase (TIGR01549 family)
MNQLKAVFFDFGGTIDLYPVDTENALKAMENMISILKESGIDISHKYTVEEFYKIFTERHKRYKNWKSKTLIELSGLEVWKKYILFDEPEIEKLDEHTAEELTFLIETGRFNRTARPEMKKVMEELVKNDLLYGIISNVLSLTQVPRNLVDYGLESYFSKLVLSSAFGRSKPDPSIFLYAAQEAGFLPEECLYVGNSPLKDIFGASNAGFLGTVQIEYLEDIDDVKDPGVAPDYYIKSMEELPEIIQSYLNKN